MKRIFTLILTACAMLSASASDLTFSVEVVGRNIVVTPSSDSQKYYAICLSEEDMAYCTETLGLSLDTPEQFVEPDFYVGTKTHFNSSYTFNTMPDGDYVVVMCATEDASEIIVSGEVFVEKVTVDVVADDDVTFEFSCTADSFSVTPSNDESKYAVFVITPYNIVSLEEVGANFSYYAYNSITFARDVDYTHTGKSEFTKADWNITENDRHVVAVMGVDTFTEKSQVSDEEHTQLSNTTPVYCFDWNVGQDPQAIRTIETSISRSGKVLEGGKVIINGKVMLDGTLVK